MRLFLIFLMIGFIKVVQIEGFNANATMNDTITDADYSHLFINDTVPAKDNPNYQVIIEKKLRTLINEVITTCSNKYPMPIEDVYNTVYLNAVPSDENGQKWVSCFLQLMAVVQDGQIDWKQWRYYMLYRIKDEDDLIKVDKVVKNCKTQVSLEGKNYDAIAYDLLACKVLNWTEDDIETEVIEEYNYYI